MKQSLDPSHVDLYVLVIAISSLGLLTDNSCPMAEKCVSSYLLKLSSLPLWLKTMHDKVKDSTLGHLQDTLIQYNICGLEHKLFSEDITGLKELCKMLAELRAQSSFRSKLVLPQIPISKVFVYNLYKLGIQCLSNDIRSSYMQAIKIAHKRLKGSLH